MISLGLWLEAMKGNLHLSRHVTDSHVAKQLDLPLWQLFGALSCYPEQFGI